MKERRFFWAVVISLVLHLLLFWLYGIHGSPLQLFPSPSAEERQKNERRMAFEIVDTPEANRSGLPPDRANLLSDKNSRARDNAEGPPEGDLPYSQGDIDVKSLDPSSTRNAQLSQMGENANARERETETREAWAEARTWNEGSGFSRERLLGQSPSQPAVRSYN